jgi:hypothetical protein
LLVSLRIHEQPMLSTLVSRRLEELEQLSCLYSQILPDSSVMDVFIPVFGCDLIYIRNYCPEIVFVYFNIIIIIYSHYPRVQLPAASHFVLILLLLSMFYFLYRLFQLISLVLSLSAFYSMIRISLCF